MNLSPLNVGHILSLASDDEIAEGCAWYPTAHTLAASWHPDIKVAAGVIAALSPQAGWRVNQIWAQQSCLTGDAIGNTTANRTKAQRFLNGEPAESIFATAPKTRSFYQTIVNPATDAVVLDRHAMSVAAGYWMPANDSARVLGRKGEYDRISDMYRVIAAQWGILVSEVQAITWVTLRHMLDSAWHYG